MRTKALAGLAVCVALVNTPTLVLAQAQNPTLTSIPDNTALHLGKYTNNPLSNDCGGPISITAYSKFAYDSKNHQLLMFGGGHAATPRTDVSVFSFSTLAWSSAYAPTFNRTIANKDYTRSAWLSTGHPWARHTYDQLIFAPNTGELIIRGGFPGGAHCTEYSPTEPPFNLLPAHYDPVAKTWTYGVGGWRSWTSQAEYDPVSGQIICLDGAGLSTYDPVSKTGKQRMGFSKFLGYANELVYFPPNQKMYSFNRVDRNVWEVSLNRGNFGLSTVTKLAISGPYPPHGEPGYAYDPVNKIIGGAITNGVFYAFNPVTLSWTSSTLKIKPGGPSVVGTQATHCLDYDPVDNVFLFLTDYTSGGHMWAYRYKAGGPPPPPTAPTITTQPSNRTVTAGGTATFSVVASGTAPFSYQWQKNGLNIAGATGASYTTPATTIADNGSTYRAIVTNVAGSATSNAATLTVTAVATAPTITTQPANQTVTAGQTATFTVAASGTAPLSYQWQKNGVNIAGATSTSYTTPATTAADNGATYRVVVTNAAGTATSNAATLTVSAGAADSDGDGLPDSWEQTHFGDLSQGPNGDPDGDGATNLQEYQGGTDPADPASRPVGVGLPLPWVHADVGAVGVSGTASYAGATFTGSGSGDIWDVADRFHFIYQPFNGDVQITSRVASLLSPNVWAKAGVMVRESLAPGSAHTLMAVTSGVGTVYQGRSTTNGVSVSAAGPAVAAPSWVRIVRTGNLLTGFASPDGTGWTVVGTQTIAMGASIYVGLAVSSDDNATLNTSTFDNVSVTTGGGGAGDADGDGLPDAWEMTSFGNLNQTASGDPDADGATNLEEYLAGTDPMNPASLPPAAVASGRDNPNGNKCGLGAVAAGQGLSFWTLALAILMAVLGFRPRGSLRRGEER